MGNLINLIIKSIVILLVGVVIYEIPYLFNELKYAISPYDSYDVIDNSNRDESMFDTGSQRILEPINIERNIIFPKLGINEEVFSSDSIDGVFIPKESRNPGSSGEVIIKTFHTNLELMNRKNAQYALLHKLKKDDEIIIHHNGKRITYKVKEIDYVPQLEYEAGIEKKYPYSLRVDTQWPPGFYFQKQLVYATLN